MIASVGRLALWEWFKLQRRWMLWILLLFAILFAQLTVWGSYFSYRNLESTGGEVPVPGQTGRPRLVACNDLLSADPSRQPADIEPAVLEGLRAQCRQQAAALPQRLARGYADILLPGSLADALDTLEELGLILMAILAASAIGIDYGTGTLRSVLVQGVGRRSYLAAKLLTLAIVGALGLLLATLTVALSSVVASGLLAGQRELYTTDPPTWADAGVALWKAWSALLPYLALTAMVTVLARSSAAGMAIGLGYYFAEQILVALLSGVFTWFPTVADYLPVRNISAWTGGGLGPAAGLPDQTHALLVLAAYTAGFLAIAFWLFHRRDVQGASSS